MEHATDYLDLSFGPLHNRVAHAELLDRAGELITAFLHARDVPASARTLCRERGHAPPLLLIITPNFSAPEAIDALKSSNACNPHFPFMDFESVAIPVRDKNTGQEGVLLNAGQGVILKIASALEQRPS